MKLGSFSKLGNRRRQHQELYGWKQGARGGGAGSVTVLSNNYIIGSKPWGKGENANKGKTVKKDNSVDLEQGPGSPSREQFSSIPQLCLIICDHVDVSTPGFPVHHQLLELAQTHFH